ncbi:MAG: hypothetical protein J3Q66DRAFT_138948 [Benniella sp.]|nr:MAG: hypothetical protein J3Q66DRAFT_138948 [Benniella sp.]
MIGSGIHRGNVFIPVLRWGQHGVIVENTFCGANGSGVWGLSGTGCEKREQVPQRSRRSTHLSRECSRKAVKTPRDRRRGCPMVRQDQLRQFPLWKLCLFDPSDVNSALACSSPSSHYLYIIIIAYASVSIGGWSIATVYPTPSAYRLFTIRMMRRHSFSGDTILNPLSLPPRTK